MAKKANKKQNKKTSKQPKKPKLSRTVAILVLLLNIIFIPGVGTLLGWKISTGIWQIILSLVGVLLSIILIGIPIVIAAWIWGLVSGIQMIQESA